MGLFNQMKGVLLFVFLSIIFVVAKVMAEPIIIKDYGKAKPIGWVLKDQRTLAVSPKNPVAELLKEQWPLKTQLTAGRVDDKSLPKTLAGKLQTPIFLIGSDKYSRQWLKQKKPDLIKMGAKGIVIEARNHKHYRQLAAMAKPLEIEMMNVDDIARKLGVTNYPVLISNQGIKQ